jgi:hypothetical protein
MSTIANNLTSRLLRSAAASVLLMTAFSASAEAAGSSVQIMGDGFGLSQIKVISENGTSWTKIEKGDFAMPVTIKIGMPGFYVDRYNVRQLAVPAGQYNGTGNPAPRTEQVDLSTVYKGDTDYLGAAERQEIIALCNTKLGEGKGIHESHNTFGLVSLELRGWFEEKGMKINQNGAGEGQLSTGKVAIRVKCEGKPAAANDVVAKTPDFQVRDIQLRFMTSAGHVTKPNPGAKCQLTQARVRVGTSKAGPVKFKLWTKVGAEPMQSQFVEAWSSFVSPGKFEAVFTKPISVSKTTSVQAMAEDKTNPIGQSTGWKQVSLDCTGAGGGGFAGTPNTSNPDNGAHAPPQAPGRVFGGKARPTHVAPLFRSRFGEARFAPMPQANATGAKDRFYPSKPHVN